MKKPRNRHRRLRRRQRREECAGLPGQPPAEAPKYLTDPTVTLRQAVRWATADARSRPAVEGIQVLDRAAEKLLPRFEEELEKGDARSFRNALRVLASLFEAHNRLCSEILRDRTASIDARTKQLAATRCAGGSGAAEIPKRAASAP